MTELKLGAATVQRIEECYEPNFDASAFFPDGNPTFVQRHRDWLLPDHYARLKPAGVEPDQVDMVMSTHLHVDHVGWNTRLENGKWVPTFKNATGPANGGSFHGSVLQAALRRNVLESSRREGT